MKTQKFATKKWLTVLILFVLAITTLIPTYSSAQTDSLKEGPYLNRILYNVIQDNDEMVIGLQDGTIDVIGKPILPTVYDTLMESEEIEVVSTPRNGFSIFFFNCAKYPFNITNFRRAAAFAFDKERVISEVWHGYAYLQDCPIPSSSIFSAEGLLDFSYYEANLELANQLLDDAGFVDVDADGLREAPDGSEFDVLIEAARTSDAHNQTGMILEEAFNELHIDAVFVPTDFYEYLDRIYCHYDFDIALMERDYGTTDIYGFAYDYWSEYADEPYWNFPNFRNASFDAWHEQLLHGTTFDEVHEAAIEMQKIWVEACPGIIAYQNEILSAYRIDRLEGFVNSVQSGVPCWWTNFRTHLSDESNMLGGKLSIGIPFDIESFNFMMISTENIEYVLNNMYDSLIRQSPDGNDIPWIAESFTVETHDDNAAVPDGYTRFTFDIREDIFWSDGQPLTGEDIAFSFNYYRDAPGNIYGFDLSELAAAYSPSTYRVVTDFNSESYWHLHTIGYKPIIPKHVFQEFGPENWNLWNPDPLDDEMVTSGPFNVSDYVMGEYIELTYNPEYFLGLGIHPPDSTTPSNDQQIDDLDHVWTEDIFGIPGVTLVSLSITIPSIIVIVVVLFNWRRERPEMFSSSWTDEQKFEII